MYHQALYYIIIMKVEAVGSLPKNRLPLIKVESLINKSIRVESLRIESLTNKSIRAESRS